MKGVIGRPLAGAVCVLVLLAATAAAQTATGTIAGTVTDSTGGVLPGVAVSLSGERLLGGIQTETTDVKGVFRFDRLPPGLYDVKFEMQGFKTVQRSGVRISAGFTATVNVPLEVGQVAETVTVTGASPTVDTKSTLQQTVMSQEILEGVPTGRDPWSLAKIIPGVQVSTYDVGGTQSMNSSNLSSHGSSTDDVVYAIDGMNTNFVGSNGGGNAIYFDQGMFDEVDYQTSALPAENSIGGVFINMVTKQGGNKLTGDLRVNYSNQSLQGNNWSTPELQKYGFAGGNPVTKLYDVNLTAGGPIKKDRVWWFGSYRRWAVTQLTLGARNPDGSYAIDDSWITNGSGKATWQLTSRHRINVLVNFDQKRRPHRIDSDTGIGIPASYVPNIATQNQTSNHWQGGPQYTGIFGNAVFESRLSIREGTGYFTYQDGVNGAIRVQDLALSTAAAAGPWNITRPNGLENWENSLAYHVPSWAGEHNFKGGVQITWQQWEEDYQINGDEYLIYNNGVPNEVVLFNTPTSVRAYEHQIGIFIQDTWTPASRLSVNIGARYDHLVGGWPTYDVPAGTWVPDRQLTAAEPVHQQIGVWRLGVIWDVMGNGKTALKASASRYGSSVGIQRVTAVEPLTYQSGTRSWTDLNHDGMAEPNELGPFSGFSAANVRYADANGGPWPYSDEYTAGVEHELRKDLRVALMYYHRTNRDAVGTRNMAVPTSAYVPATVTVPGAPQGPGGTVTFYNLLPAYFGLQQTVLNADPLLNTTYNGLELTAAKRLSNRWQLVAGLTLSSNKGGLNFGDLNDPNNLINQQGTVGDHSKYSAKASGSYMAPWGFNVSGAFLYNNGYPYQSKYTITRSAFPGLTRANQVVYLTERGTERMPNVAMLDLRISRPIKLGGGRQLTPQVELFNIGNSSAITALTTGVGGHYLYPSQILGPRMVRFGFDLQF